MAQYKQQQNQQNKNNKNPQTANQGSVQYSDDGRLKENRDQGIHRGDEE